MKNNEWVKEYIRLMKEDKSEEGIPLKEKYFPKRFYKYKPLNKYTINSLKEDWLWCPKINALNDPFECSLLMDENKLFINHVVMGKFKQFFKEKFNITFTDSDIEKIANSADPYSEFMDIAKQKNFIVNTSNIPEVNKFSHWKDFIKTAREAIHICSFSEINDSILMWSHYADEHRGICIEYDFYDADKVRVFIQPVYYTDTLYTISSFNEMDNINAIMASTVKSADWAYEREWRYTNWKKKSYKENLHKMAVPIAKAIYLGPRIDSNKNIYLKNNLLKIANERQIPVYQMQSHPTKFKLEVNNQ